MLNIKQPLRNRGFQALVQLNRPDDEVYASYDSDNAADIVSELYITSPGDCCLAMLNVGVVALRLGGEEDADDGNG